MMAKNVESSLREAKRGIHLRACPYCSKKTLSHGRETHKTILNSQSISAVQCKGCKQHYKVTEPVIA
ncbi:MAG: hypothetical protein ACYTGH_05920 [Planctomycetota bacterium]